MHTILIIDDEKEILELTRKRLEKSGFRMLIAQSGEEGLRQASQQKPDLILLDIVMPHKDGFAVLKELKSRENTWDIPVIMLTAKSETSFIVDSQNAGAVDYFIKPFDWEELLKYIRKYIAMTSENALAF